MSDLDEERARLLGVLHTKTDFTRCAFPIIRRKWKQPHEMSFEEAIAYMLGPVNPYIQPMVGSRKTFLVDILLDDIKESNKP